MGDRRPPVRTAFGRSSSNVSPGARLVFRRELVLMDEPLGPWTNSCAKPLQFESRIWRMNGAVPVYLTHDQTEALDDVDRRGRVRKWAIQQLAPPESAVRRAENSFVAQFIGENNTLEGLR